MGTPEQHLLSSLVPSPGPQLGVPGWRQVKGLYDTLPNQDTLKHKRNSINTYAVTTDVNWDRPGQNQEAQNP